MKHLTILLALCGIILMAGCSSETPGRVAILEERMAALEASVGAIQPVIDTIKAQEAQLARVNPAVTGMAIREEIAALENVKTRDMNDQQLALLLRTVRATEAAKELQKRAEAAKKNQK